jgi:hypothetical protein
MDFEKVDSLIIDMVRFTNLYNDFVRIYTAIVRNTGILTLNYFYLRIKYKLLNSYTTSIPLDSK